MCHTLPVLAKLTALAPVDHFFAEKREAEEGAEQEHVREIPIGHDMRAGPEADGGQRRMAYPTDESGMIRVEFGISRAAEGTRVGPREGECDDDGCKRICEERYPGLPRHPRLELDEGRRSRGGDEPDEHGDGQGGIGEREASGADQGDDLGLDGGRTGITWEAKYAAKARPYSNQPISRA